MFEVFLLCFFSIYVKFLNFLNIIATALLHTGIKFYSPHPLPPLPPTRRLKLLFILFR